MRRLVVVFFAVLVGYLVVPAHVAVAGAAVDQADTEQAFVDNINALRLSEGLGQLRLHPELVDVARGWASKMSAVDKISHDPDLADAVRADWQKLGENVGVGMTVERLHAAFVASPAHYGNIIDPAFTHIGVGVVFGRDDVIFTTHQFMTLRPAAVVAVVAAAAEAAEESPKAPAELVVAPARLVLVLQQLRALDAR